MPADASSICIVDVALAGLFGLYDKMLPGNSNMQINVIGFIMNSGWTEINVKFVLIIVYKKLTSSFLIVDCKN